MTRFAHERALCSSTGLTPSAYASGPSVRRGHRSRQGSGRVRHLLIETAWRALPRDPVLQEIFDRIAATRGKKRAMVAIARRLTGRIRACFRQGTTYAVGTYAVAPAHDWHEAWPLGSWCHSQSQRHQTAINTLQRKDRKDCGSALHGSRHSHSGMNSVTTATSLPSLCRHHGQHGRKCEAQDVSWSRTNKQLEAWLRPRPRITGSSAEKLALIGRTSACWVQSRT